MLDWLRRITSAAPRAQLVENENQTPSTEEKVERLVGRFGPSRNISGDSVVAFPPSSAPTFVIAVAAQKGGAGKTTITAHRAVQAGAAGQGPGGVSMMASAAPRLRNAAELAASSSSDIVASGRLSSLRARHHCDNEPCGSVSARITALTTSIEQIIGIADLVLIPARPSPHDLRAVGATVELTRRAGKRFLFVVNGAAPRANITAEAVAALSEHGQVAPVILYQRTDYAASMIDGRTVIETAAGGRSAQEIAELWSYVYGQISVREAA